jgi:cell division protein FtsB
MGKNRNKTSHVAKTKKEQNRYASIVLMRKEYPTMPEEAKGTLGDMSYDEKAYSDTLGNRSSKKNRLFLHLKNNISSYIVGLVSPLILVLALFFFKDFDIRLTNINNDITNQNDKIEQSAKNIEKLSDDVNSFKADLKSLNDRFGMFIDLFKKQDNK